ncbi:SLC13 family permease [Neolewinella antarctica]|uniref:Sodium-dependent dicarboxylate transporter 2/3/5 n=1 Tax=Neolewinella antarctica TaxID=442734 RepID=A0ABX0X9K3_9BACT|nr:SLC13 family permease [Neolewinella antarctica]NJC25867.1 sodium-dependent dicarboxylate transporter 2/3/5 [Neolewinella antarctica]
MNQSTNRISLVCGPALFVLILLFFQPPGMSDQANAVLACTAWIATWWIFETLPISVTALLPLVIFPLSGALDIQTTAASFGHKYIFLYLGGFVLAIAIERWNLHKRIALNIINVMGTSIPQIILGFMVATAALSMWISNTATSVMMLPIGMAIVSQLNDNPATVADENKLFGKSLMLAIAYAASIGGIASLIGTPPNLVLAGVVEELYGIEISFLQWMKFGLPISIILLACCWVYLTKIAFRFKQAEFPGGRSEIQRLLRQLGPMGHEEKIVLVVFITTALLWILRSLVLTRFLPALDDTIIAVTSAIILFLLPARGGERKLVTWEEAVKLPWGIILLFGGGLALASGFQESGLAEWIATQLTLLQGVSLAILLLIIITSVNFLTEITSNLATTAMLLPVLAPMALSLGFHPYILLVAATVAASCAFMLPVATPPNAVVFGSGYLRIPDMVRNGVWMNLFSVLVVLLAVYYFLPVVWGFDPFVYPVGWGG